nr:unnamed protein product [Callosobruchus analis]
MVNTIFHKRIFINYAIDPEDINEGKTSSEPGNTMEHFKKRLIHQCEEDTTLVDTNEKTLQEASETSNETEKTTRSALKGRHTLPAVVNPIPERRRNRTGPTKNLGDGNNNTDMCNSLENNYTLPQGNSRQPPEKLNDSTEKPESLTNISPMIVAEKPKSSIESSSNIPPTTVAEKPKSSTETSINISPMIVAETYRSPVESSGNILPMIVAEKPKSCLESCSNISPAIVPEKPKNSVESSSNISPIIVAEKLKNSAESSSNISLTIVAEKPKNAIEIFSNISPTVVAGKPKSSVDNSITISPITQTEKPKISLENSSYMSQTFIAGRLKSSVETFSNVSPTTVAGKPKGSVANSITISETIQTEKPKSSLESSSNISQTFIVGKPNSSVESSSTISPKIVAEQLQSFAERSSNVSSTILAEKSKGFVENSSTISPIVTGKPKSSAESSNKIRPTTVAEANKTAPKQLEEDFASQIEQDNPINLCVKKTKPENEVVKERPRTVNGPQTNKYPPPKQRNVPTKPSQKIVPMSTSSRTNAPQTHKTQSQHESNNLQDEVLRSIVTLVRDTFCQPFSADSLLILNNWYKHLKTTYIVQDKSGSSYAMWLSVLRETEDFVLRNLYSFANGRSTLSISRKFVQQVLSANLNAYKDHLDYLLSTNNRTADWFKRLYETLEASVQASNSDSNILPTNSISNDRNPSVAKPPHSVPNLNVTQEHSISTSQQAEPPSTRAQPIYSNATPSSSTASGQKNTNIPPSYLQSNAAQPQYNQRMYVPLNYPVPNAGTYSNGIPSLTPQQMSALMENSSVLDANRSEYLKVQQEMHMAMMQQMARYPHIASQGMHIPTMNPASLPVNSINNMQGHFSVANSVPEVLQARQNFQVPLMQQMPVASSFKPEQLKRQRDGNRHMYPRQVSVPVSATSQQSSSVSISVQQIYSQHPTNASLEQLRINEMHNVRDPRLLSITSKPEDNQSTAKSKHGVQQARSGSEVKSGERDPVILPKTIQRGRISVISSVKLCRQSTQQKDPNLVVPVLHIPEVSPDSRGWMDPLGSQEKRVPIDTGTQQSRHHVLHHVTHQAPVVTTKAQMQVTDNKLKVIEIFDLNGTDVFYPTIRQALLTLSTIPRTAATVERSFSTLRRVKAWLRSTIREKRLTGLCLLSVHQDLHNDSAGCIRRNIRESGIDITTTTYADRSNARPANKPCTVTSALITEPSKVSTSTSLPIVRSQNAEKYQQEYGRTLPNINHISENSTKQISTIRTKENVTKATIPTRTSVNLPGTLASSCKAYKTSNTNSQDSALQCEGGRGSHGSSNVFAPIVTQDIEEVIQTNVIVDPAKTIERNNLQNTLPPIITANNLPAQLNEDLQLTALKQINSKRQMIQVEDTPKRKKVAEVNDAVEEQVKRNADEAIYSRDLNSSENELRLIKEVLRNQFKDTYPEIVKRVLLAKEEQGKLKNGCTDVNKGETISVLSSTIPPKRQSEDELGAAPKRVKANGNMEPNLSESHAKTVIPYSLPIIEDISSDDDANCDVTAQAITFSLLKTPESPSAPLPEVWLAWLDEQRLRGNSFFSPYSARRRQSIETISSAGSDYSPRLNSDDVEIKIDTKWYRVKKHIYDRIPKGKLYLIQESNMFIRYFDANQMEQFYKGIGVENTNAPDFSRTKARVENNAEVFLIPSDPSQVNELIEVVFSPDGLLREPERYVEEMENVRQYIPKDFSGFYQFVTGYQIVRQNYPITFLTFVVLHNTNRIKKLLYNYVAALMQGQCMH